MMSKCVAYRTFIKRYSTNPWFLKPRIELPKEVPDGDVVESDGTDRYTPDIAEIHDQWEEPRLTPLMECRVDGMTYFEIWSQKQPRLTYYLRKDQDNVVQLLKTTTALEPNLVTVDHVVHPYKLAAICLDGEPAEGISPKKWTKIQRAVLGDDRENLQILARVLHSPANLRCLDRRIYAMKSCIQRGSVGGAPPNYAEHWARSDAWGSMKYLKTTQAQHEAVTAALGNAIGKI